MVTYTFDYGVSSTVCDDMTQVTRNINQELDDMHQRVLTTLQDWKDSAKDEYWRAKGEWEALAAQMPATLAQAQTALVQISEGYGQVEKTGVSQWSGYNVK